MGWDETIRRIKEEEAREAARTKQASKNKEQERQRKLDAINLAARNVLAPCLEQMRDGYALLASLARSQKIRVVTVVEKRVGFFTKHTKLEHIIGIAEPELHLELVMKFDSGKAFSYEGYRYRGWSKYDDYDRYLETLPSPRGNFEGWNLHGGFEKLSPQMEGANLATLSFNYSHCHVFLVWAKQEVTDYEGVHERYDDKRIYVRYAFSRGPHGLEHQIAVNNEGWSTMSLSELENKIGKAFLHAERKPEDSHIYTGWAL
jgi:hypothetical protein